MTAVLQVSNGSTTISLLNENGITLISWEPTVAPWKDGGIFRNNKLNDNRQLVQRNFDNAVETFNLGVVGTSQDNVIATLNGLTTLLENAVKYWLGSSSTPVYLVAKGDTETNTRYALIHAWGMERLPSPYDGPFVVGASSNGTAKASALVQIALAVERGHWLSAAPGTSSAISISATDTYNSRTLGRAATSSPKEVFFSNKRQMANLTHIYRYDASAGSYSSNLMDASLPFNLFPNSPALGDICYFGCQISVANSGPFDSLVFDIGTAATGTHTIVWEWWTGAAWSTISGLQDNTSSFRTVGVNSVHWPRAVGWATRSENGVTAYWVRARLSAFTSMPVIPAQRNRDIYAITWPYVDIASDAIGGDVLAQAKYEITPRDGDTFDNLLVGLRSTSRGSNFSAFINISDEQNPTGITVTAEGSSTSFATNAAYITGKVGTWNPAALAAMATRFSITIADPLAAEYYGTFRILARITQASGADNYSVRLNIITGVSSSIVTTETQPVPVIFGVTQGLLFDFGQITLPGSSLLSSEGVSQIVINIQASSAAAENALLFEDIILIPVDEWAGQFTTVGSGAVFPTNYLVIDGTSKESRSLVKRTSDNIVQYICNSLIVSDITLPAGTAQRLWFLSYLETVVSSVYVKVAAVEAASTLTIYTNNRYLTMRGSQ